MIKWTYRLGLLFCFTLGSHAAAPLTDGEKTPVMSGEFPGMTIELKKPNTDGETSFSYPGERDRAESLLHTDETKKLLYLTFDDGPVDGTGNLLNVLEEEGIEATMFCVGRHAKKRKNLLLRELRMPNLLVANHTYSHANGHYSRFYSNRWNVMSDVEHAQLILGGRKYLRLAGRNVWRLPEVNRNDGALSSHRRSVEIPDYDQLAKEGFFIYGWDVEWRFDHRSGRPVSTAERLANRISSLYRHRRMARKNRVVLLAHDFMFRDRSSAEELRKFIHIMKRRGWSFKKVDHYSSARPEPLYVAKYYGKPVQPIASGGRNTIPTSIKRRAVHSAKHNSELTLRERKILPVGSGELQLELNNAIRGYDAKKVDELIQRGARINQRDQLGRLALNTAIRANSIFLVKKLLTMGADIRAKDAGGNSALLTARNYKRRAIEKYLLTYALKHGEKKRVVAVNEKPERINPLKLLSQR